MMLIGLGSGLWPQEYMVLHLGVFCPSSWVCRFYTLFIVLYFIIADQPSRKQPLITALALNFFGGAMSGLIVHVEHGVFVACAGRFINGIGSGIAQVFILF